MLNITDLTYNIGQRTIIENGKVCVQDGWRVGVIGHNGAGKSTLFKLISGELEADSGSVHISSSQNMGMVRQDMPETDDSLLDVVLAANEDMAALWKRTETETDGNKIAEIFQRLEDLDAYSAPAKASMLLTGLGFKPEELSMPFSSFSGGWRMRVALAAALFVEPDILLLDEPTNHLDLEAIMWLEDYLLSYRHTLMIISHDRELLNKCIDHVIHVDKMQLTLSTGNYDTFERERALKAGLQQKMHEKQEAARAHMQSFVDRFKAQASKARQAQSRMKALEKMDIVDAVIAERTIQFTFPNPKQIPSPMIQIDHADVGYGDDDPILKRLHRNIDNDDRIALLGANGEGKSTLMKLIADKLGVMKGEITRSNKLKIGYFSQHQTDELNLNSTPYQEMYSLFRDKNGDAKEHVVRAKLGAFGFSRTLADNKIGDLSGGEKARLLFAFMSFDAPHLLLLDEPTNHLDIDTREALVQALNAYEGAIIIVSHDPNMVERVADRLWLIKDGACLDFDGDLQDYRKFTIDSRREERKKDKKKKEKVVESEKTTSSANPQVIEKLESKIATLTSQKTDLESQINAKDFYSKPEDEVNRAQNNYKQVIENLDLAEAEWLSLSTG
jgi:ATP-binding cassette subfamily F protein 3